LQKWYIYKIYNIKNLRNLQKENGERFEHTFETGVNVQENS